MSRESEYYQLRKFPHPARNVGLIVGSAIREGVSRYFSGKMLEIGCGSKDKGLLVGDLVEEHIGLDLLSCFHNKSKIDVFASAYQVPFSQGSFDCILSTAVMEHLEEPQAAIYEAFRVLKPGGYGLYTAPLFWHLHEEPRDFYRFTKYGLKHLFEKAGFEIIELKPLSGFLTTFATGFNYYLSRFRRGPLTYLVTGLIFLNDFFSKKLDKGFFRDERFTWMTLIIVRKPK